MTPFDLWCLQHNYDNRGLQYGHEAMAIPGCKGYDCRLKDGWVYVAVIPTTDEEKAQREIVCAERLAPWIEDFDREYQKYKDELMGRYYLPFQAIDMESLEDYQLQDAFDDWIELYRRGGNYHMVWLLAFAKIYTMFDDMCQKEAGFGVEDPLFSDLMAGFEQKMMEGDRGLFKLGVRVRELGLEPLFGEIKDNDELYAKLGETEAGRTWLKELDAHLWVYGWRSAENWDCGRPSWTEKPSLSFPSIRRFMARPAFPPDELRPTLIAKREAAEKEVLSRVAEEKRPEFLKLLRAAQRCGPVDQDHVFYCEHYGNALARKVTKEVAKRFVAQGVIDEPGRHLLHDARRDQPADPGPVPRPRAGGHTEAAACGIPRGRARDVHRRSDGDTVGSGQQSDAPCYGGVPSSSEARAWRRSVRDRLHSRRGRRERCAWFATRAISTSSVRVPSWSPI